TRAGEDTLAAWLNKPATPPEIDARQHAVAELRDSLDLREALACAGGALSESVDFRDVVLWGGKEQVLKAHWPRFLVLALGLATTAACLEWLFGQASSLPFVSFVLVELALTAVLGRRVERVLHAVERRAHDLNLLARMLERIERQLFAAPRLQVLK